MPRGTRNSKYSPNKSNKKRHASRDVRLTSSAELRTIYAFTFLCGNIRVKYLSYEIINHPTKCNRRLPFITQIFASIVIGRPNSLSMSGCPQDAYRASYTDALCHTPQMTITIERIFPPLLGAPSFNMSFTISLQPRDSHSCTRFLPNIVDVCCRALAAGKTTPRQTQTLHSGCHA